MQNYEYFIDPAFREAMEELCAGQDGCYIDPADVAELSIQNAGSLADLVYFENLQSLSVTLSNLDNLEEIKALKHLTELILFDNKINSLSAVWEMEQLTGLYMDQCIDVVSVSRLKNLTELEILFGDFSDSDPLKKLAKIKKLMLQACNLNDLGFASGMPGLRSVDIAKNRVKDIKPLEGLSNLQTVEIWENEISDLSPLKDLEGIRVLDISNNPICWDYCELNDLKCLPFLKKIGLYNLPVEPDWIRKARNLKEIHLGGREWEDISFLVNHPNIELISLVESSVRDISCLIKLPGLKTVWLSGNEKIEDYSPIYQLRAKGIDVHMDDC